MKRPHGFTLMEMMIALALIGILLGVTVMSASSILGQKAKTAAGELSATIRSLYDTASLSGKTCRLVISMPPIKAEDGETKYWAECAGSNLTARSDRDEELKEERLRQEKEARDDRRSSSSERKAFGSYADAQPNLAELLGAEKERVAAAARYAGYTNPEIEPRTLPGSVRLSVWTKHQKAAVKEGTAYLYFFPQGFTERSMVFVTQGSNTWTITVAPLTGKTSVAGEALEVPRI
ncbi:MAG: pilus assembly FimT family protein [Myxococcaceae bacterium]